MTDEMDPLIWDQEFDRSRCCSKLAKYPQAIYSDDCAIDWNVKNLEECTCDRGVPDQQLRLFVYKRPPENDLPFN